MKTTTLTNIPRKWAELNKIHPLRPIKDEISYDNAQEIIDALIMIPSKNKDQEDYLEALTTLFEAYENEHHSIDTSHLGPIETLKFLLDENNMNASDLGRLLGSRTMGAPILRGDRNLTKNHIEKIRAYFKVNPSLFIK